MAIRWRHKNHFKWNFVLVGDNESLLEIQNYGCIFGDFEIEEIREGRG